MRKFRVTIEETVTHEFEVDAQTPEHAESVAEQWLEEGEDGTVVASNVEYTEAVPEEDEAE